MAVVTVSSDPSNAAPEWQAGSIGWRSRELVVACPLEGLVRSVASPQETTADLGITSNTHAASSFTHVPQQRVGTAAQTRYVVR
jgi:hypothetical protein